MMHIQAVCAMKQKQPGPLLFKFSHLQVGFDPFVIIHFFIDVHIFLVCVPKYCEFANMLTVKLFKLGKIYKLP